MYLAAALTEIGFSCGMLPAHVAEAGLSYNPKDLKLHRASLNPELVARWMRQYFTEA